MALALERNVFGMVLGNRRSRGGTFRGDVAITVCHSAKSQYVSGTEIETFVIKQRRDRGKSKKREKRKTK